MGSSPSRTSPGNQAAGRSPRKRAKKTNTTIPCVRNTPQAPPPPLRLPACPCLPKCRAKDAIRISCVLCTRTDGGPFVFSSLSGLSYPRLCSGILNHRRAGSNSTCHPAPAIHANSVLPVSEGRSWSLTGNRVKFDEVCQCSLERDFLWSPGPSV